jgi:hypothetical protein
MPLKGSLRNVTGRDVLFWAYVGFAVLVLVGNISALYTAWFAPRCTSLSDLDSWCLPIGFQGPFADSWANRSWFNARASATFGLAVNASAFAVATYFTIKGHGKSRAIAYYCGLAVLIIHFVKSLVMDDFS